MTNYVKAVSEKVPELGYWLKNVNGAIGVKVEITLRKTTPHRLPQFKHDKKQQLPLLRDNGYSTPTFTFKNSRDLCKNLTDLYNFRDYLKIKVERFSNNLIIRFIFQDVYVDYILRDLEAAEKMNQLLSEQGPTFKADKRIKGNSSNQKSRTAERLAAAELGFFDKPSSNN